MNVNNGLCQELLSKELIERKKRNPSYSLRAFARDLGIGATTLSDVLSNKRRPSKKNILKIVNNLALSPSVQNHLLLNNRNKIIESKELQTLILIDDQFNLISNWYYLAILNLAKTTDNLYDVDNFSKRLGISNAQTTMAIETLKRLNLINIVNGKLVRTKKSIETEDNVPSSAVRKFHKENLDLAKASIDRDTIEMRDFFSMHMAIDPDKIPEAKKILEKAISKIEKTLETNGATEVYAFCCQLFPLSRKVQ